MRIKAIFFGICVIALFLSFSSVQVRAARFSGEYLLSMCMPDKDGKERAPGAFIACQAYIAGVLDYHNLIRSLGSSPSLDFCVPESVSMNELQKKVVYYLLRNKSEHAQFVASPGVALALYAYYPCDRKEKPAKRAK